jgi:hypothetical protein
MTGRALGEFDFDLTVEQPVLLLPPIRHPESASPRPTLAKFKNFGKAVAQRRRNAKI